jgi:Methylamine utilisation protein MauE
MFVSTVIQQVSEAAALLAGFVLLGAGVPKARGSAAFAGQITNYGIVPESAARFLARTISSSELLAGALLIAGLAAPPPLRQVGAGLAVLLFAVFLAALATAQARGRNIPCACFGGNSELETVGVHSLVRTALLLVLAAAAMLPSHGGRPLEVAGLTAVLAALVAVVTELARLLGPSRRATGVILEQLSATAAPHDQAEVMS